MRVVPSDRSAAFVADLAVSLLAPAASLLLAHLIHITLGLDRLGLLFLAAVTAAASLRGSRAALVSALVGVICYKIFLNLGVGEPTSTLEDVLNLLIFLVVALLTGALAGKLRDESDKTRRHAKEMELLFEACRALSTEDKDAFWPAIARTVAEASGGAALALDSAGTLQASAGEINNADAQVARGREVIQALVSGAVPIDLGGWHFRRIPSYGPAEGLLLWQAPYLDEKLHKFVDVITELASASLARAQVRREQIRIQAAEEAGRLRETLLSSISHDFRSPLAAIIGSATSLLEYGERFDDATRRDLLTNIQDEGERLNQFVANLLNFTKLQSGVIRPNTRPILIADVLQSVIERVRRHRGQAAELRIESDCEVQADPMLLEQVLYNILDNASKYAPSDEGVEIGCSVEQNTAKIIIADYGPGLSDEDHLGVFTTFHHARRNGQSQGTGLGLSIARGFVEAMGGAIQARNRTDGCSGLQIEINLPRSLS